MLFDGANAAEARAARHTLVEVLDALLRIAHPIVPFRDGDALAAGRGGAGPGAAASRVGTTAARQPLPSCANRFRVKTPFHQTPTPDAALDWLKRVVTAIRNIRGELNVPPGKAVRLLLQGGTARDRELLAATETPLARLAKVGDLAWLAADEEPAAGVRRGGGRTESASGAGRRGGRESRAGAPCQRAREGGQGACARGRSNSATPPSSPKPAPAVVAKERTKGDALRKRSGLLDDQLRRLAALDPGTVTFRGTAHADE